jgi:hypothetical protein
LHPETAEGFGRQNDHHTADEPETALITGIYTPKVGLRIGEDESRKQERLQTPKKRSLKVLISSSSQDGPDRLVGDTGNRISASG